MNHLKRDNQKGFTIVELVVVIIILGILAATALPRFLDVSDDAHAAAVEAVLGAIQSSNAMVHAEWLAEGKPTTVDVDGTSVTVSTSGYPVGDAISQTACTTLFSTLIQNAPAINAEADTNNSSAVRDPTDAFDWYTTTESTGGSCYFVYGGRGTPATSYIVATSAGVVTLTNN